MHPEHVAWMGGSSPRPYPQVAGTPEGAYVIKLFEADLKIWEDHWQDKAPSEVRNLFWGRARHDAHASYREVKS